MLNYDLNRCIGNQMSLPKVVLIIYPNITSFHFSVPQIIFSIELPGEGALFDLKIASFDGEIIRSDNYLSIQPDGGLELLDSADIIVVAGWSDLEVRPEAELIESLISAHQRGAKIVGLCYGAYVLAYSSLLDGKKAVTHWLAEEDFSKRFPLVKLDNNALYIEEDGIVTSAGTGASLDCCLYLVREIYNSNVANKVARIMVIPPHREGGQAQFIEQPIPKTIHDSQINKLLDYLRENISSPHNIDELAKKISMSRRTFTRHFNKATGMTFTSWLINERINVARGLLEMTNLSIEKIAELSGFFNVTSFRQHFREKYQVSPNTWRKTFGNVTN